MVRGKIGPRLASKVACDISWDDKMLEFYSVDASSYTLRPLAIAFPRNEKNLIEIMRFAARNKVAVTARGAGTGLVGGSLGSGIILDMRHFDKIKVGRRFVQVESGVSKGRLDDILKKHERFLGPNPSIGPFCTIGGMIGTNASGSHSLKYGSTIDNLIQVRIVTSKGKIVSLPDKGVVARNILRVVRPEIPKKFPSVSKNSCGYRIDKISSIADVQKIVAGSEGTLGVITSAKLRTFPLPERTVLLIMSYKTLREAVIDVPKILKLGPSAVEIIDDNIVQYVTAALPRKTRCLLFIEFDEDIQRKRASATRLLSGKLVKSTTHPKQIAQWWTFRHSALSYSLRSISSKETVSSLIEDATVPVHRLPLLLDLVDYIRSKYHIRTIIYGHAGNGNLHIRPILKKEKGRLINDIAKEFFAGVISIGGSITGEHGDGLARTKFVELQYGKKTYAVFKKVKKFFDPTNTLNPGKIVT